MYVFPHDNWKERKIDADLVGEFGTYDVVEISGVSTMTLSK